MRLISLIWFYKAFEHAYHVSTETVPRDFLMYFETDIFGSTVYLMAMVALIIIGMLFFGMGTPISNYIYEYQRRYPKNAR